MITVIEQSYSSGKTIITIQQALFVHIGGDDFRCIQVQIRLKGIGFFQIQRT